MLNIMFLYCIQHYNIIWLYYILSIYLKYNYSCFTYKIIISGIIYLFTNYIYPYINKYYFFFIYI